MAPLTTLYKVVDIKGVHKGTISFMRRTRSTRNDQLRIKFPAPANIALVDAKFVFDWDPTVSSTK